ncbi:MarR family transcriptional regulator [Candidatus Saccharibacteria bacterium]|nr:MarR family transcriptional regulator [Candidatus Saccharibacteria bacterium]MCL1962842.1 MarR family transcriptional regulator [Candidatus Saccharibacteria bacterium]
MCIFTRKKSGRNGAENGADRPLLKRPKSGAENDAEIVPLNETEIAVLREISRNPYIKIAKITAETGRSRSAIQRALAELKQRGIITRIGGAFRGRWKISEVKKYEK